MAIPRATETRWNSELKLMDHIVKNAEKINYALGQSDNHEMILKSKELRMLSNLIEIFNFFGKATDILHAEKNPTTARVIPIIQQLENATMSSRTDDASISGIKQSLINSLQRRVQFLSSSHLHIVATVLDPNVKLDFTESKKSEERLFSFEVTLLSDHFRVLRRKNSIAACTVIDLNTEMPTKKIKLSDFSIKSTKQRTDWKT